MRTLTSTYTVVASQSIRNRDDSLSTIQRTYECTVRTNDNGTKFVIAPFLGCSRDYHVKTDRDAVSSLLSEHSATIVTFKKFRA